MLNMTYRGRRDRCHGWYNAVTAVFLKAVYGKMVKVRDVIKRMLLFLVGKAGLSSAKKKKKPYVLAAIDTLHRIFFLTVHPCIIL
jgi:hypothetical protein